MSAAKCMQACRHDQEVQMFFRPNRGIIVVVRHGGLNISETTDLLGFSRTTVSRVYREWCEKQKIASEQLLCGKKHVVNERGQRKRAKLVKADSDSNANNHRLQNRYATLKWIGYSIRISLKNKSNKYLIKCSQCMCLCVLVWEGMFVKVCTKCVCVRVCVCVCVYCLSAIIHHIGLLTHSISAIFQLLHKKRELCAVSCSLLVFSGQKDILQIFPGPLPTPPPPPSPHAPLPPCPYHFCEATGVHSYTANTDLNVGLNDACQQKNIPKYERQYIWMWKWHLRNILYFLIQKVTVATYLLFVF